MDKENKIREATELLVQAKKTENASGGFLSKFLGGSASKLDEAQQIYTRAANQFKSVKQWEQAGNAFRNAARLQASNGLSLRHEAAQSLVDAGNCYRKVNADSGLDAYKEAIEILTDMGRFTMAAKHLVSCGDIHNENRDFVRAVEQYQKAADYFKSEESHTTADKHVVKAADLLCSELEQFKQAQEIYEVVGSRCADQSLLKYSAKDHFFKAALCHMNIDVINAQQALERYSNILPSFQDTREFNLLQKLVKAMDESKVDDFTEAVQEYDNISRLNDLTAKLLLTAKKTIDGEDDDLT